LHFELTRHARNGEVRFNIETKTSPEAPEDTADPVTFARALIKVVRDNGMAGRTSIQSFDWRTLAVVQKEAPEIATSYLTSQQQALDNIEAGRREESRWTAGIRFADHGSVPKMVKAAGGKIWSPNHLDLTEASVKEAKSLGLAGLPWTVNDRASMERLIGWGVDGLIADYPDRLREILAAKNLPLPRATPVTPRVPSHGRGCDHRRACDEHQGIHQQPELLRRHTQHEGLGGIGPSITTEPTISPLTKIVHGSAPSWLKVTAFATYIESDASASVARNAPFTSPRARKNGVLIGPVEATMPVRYPITAPTTASCE
jgi:hypothetical protein